MSYEMKALPYISGKTEVPEFQIKSVLELSITENCTVPFIARYRKEKTGGVDEIKIRAILEYYSDFLEIEKRRAYIHTTIKEMGKLTADLEKSIASAETLNHLEDIYAPFKSKKKTKAQAAREKGLDPLADILLATPLSPGEIESKHASEFVPGPNGDIACFADALDGARDILVDRFAHDLNIKERLRTAYWKEGIIVSTKHDDAETVPDHLKFRDFFDYKEPVHSLKEPRSIHRFLAMRRGMLLKVLKVDVLHKPEYAQELIEGSYFPKRSALGCYATLKKCAEQAYAHYLHLSLDLEIKSELKKLADESSIHVFGKNLKDLLLSPYLGAKSVMGVDPGIRTGCKIVVVENTGKLLEDTVIYPHQPKNDIAGSRKTIDRLLQKYDIKFIAIGNGTYGRETLSFFEENIEAVKSGQTKATIISEAGASIYSVSPLAAEEFPDKDPTVRGSVSIARRFQDPLAELVKIDPKSIGVGQYQHDVNQVKLKVSLDSVVESCVNYVGVDLNTASIPLLSYVSGISKTLATHVVKYRESSGGFKERAELLNVPRFSAKAFELSAGFLRIYNGINPLDATFIHPERYESLARWAQKRSIQLPQLAKDTTFIDQLAQDPDMRQEVGEMTLKDIVKSLKTPSQDPRTTFKSVEFHKGLSSLNDITIGAWYTGVVANITQFGAFVNIGIKETGLVHKSELADTYVENPLDVLHVGKEIKVRVLSKDLERSRLALSCKKGESSVPVRSGEKRQHKKPEKPGVSDSPFAVLKKLIR
jgi:uncharacterized protein